jgi:predicted nucleic acid-binding protein
MIRKAFVDSDVILDLATGREPFIEHSKAVLSIIESGYAIGLISSNSVTNIHYVLRKLSSSSKAKDFLKTLLQYVSAVPVDHGAIMQALESEFYDFEDGVQHFCALKNQCDFIITRNGKHYTMSEVKVLEPKEFVALYQQ